MRARVPQLKLGPRYRVLGEIASGGMGAVLLALRRDDQGASKPVAIKQLHAHLVDDPQMVASFVDEARIASRLDHLNVVRVHDVEMIGEDLVLVMDYVDGVTLSQLLKASRLAGKMLPVEVTRRILHDVLSGLHAAHELRGADGEHLHLVHRDVSPQNLLVGTDGVTRVTDFGVALATGRLASTQVDGAVKGKLQYLSPEQIYRRPVDRRADVFAAGIILWECLTGKKLFGGATEAETLAMVIREPIAPPSAERFEVPFELDEICLRALEREPERRHASALELAEALASGPMASREEVASLVESLAGESLAARRALLARGTAAPQGTEPQAEARPGASLATAPGPPAPPAARPRSGLAIAALLVGSIAGGALVWLAGARSQPVAAPPGASAAPPLALTTAPAASPAAATETHEDPSPDPSAVVHVEEPTAAGVGEPTAGGSASARPRPVQPPRVSPRGGVRRADAGRGRPFMPDDL